jgi:hypothetical protein
MFVGPDQGIYQVINPASDTSLSISPAYRGAAAVGGAGYGIVPVNGYPKALADAVNLFGSAVGRNARGPGERIDGERRPGGQGRHRRQECSLRRVLVWGWAPLQQRR